jgi:hypothetical protein
MHQDPINAAVPAAGNPAFRRRLSFLPAICVTLGLSGCDPQQRHVSTPPPSVTVTQVADGDSFKPKVVIRKRFEPITEFDVLAVADAVGKINDNELVIGVTAGGGSRAYPINMLTGPSREILNDTLGDVPLAATW